MKRDQVLEELFQKYPQHLKFEDEVYASFRFGIWEDFQGAENRLLQLVELDSMDDSEDVDLDEIIALLEK
jgi:hypothetical protein